LKRAISIGTFDAVHLGHQALIQAARTSVGESGHIEVWSFDPPPKLLLDSNYHFNRITPFETRANILKSLGVDIVRKIEPTHEFLNLDPVQFIKMVIEQSSPDYFVEGDLFRFGKDRAGSIDTLSNLGSELNFECISVPSIDVSLLDHSIVPASSSTVRWLLREGRVQDAHRVLGRPFSFSGVVTQGDKRGREIGFPTANLSGIETMLPKNGIYSGIATLESMQFPAAISIGTKPTFGNAEITCEAHIIGFDGPINHYDWPLSVTICQWLRDQVKFDNVEALSEAIRQDIEQTKSLIESTL